MSQLRESQEILRARELETFIGRVKPIAHLLADPAITDISLNEPRILGDRGRVFVDVVGKGYVPTDVFLTAPQAELILRTFALANKDKQVEFNRSHPRLSCQAASGQLRIEAEMPPATLLAPVFTIRKYIRRGRRLSDYVADGQLTAEEVEQFVAFAGAGKSMIIAGATGAGKTTLTNALLLELGQDESVRMVTIEDEPELERPNDASLQIVVGPGLSYVDAVKSALRHNPDYIVLGEIRDAVQAKEAVNAWDSDHAGIATMHVKSVERIPKKLLRFCRSLDGGLVEEDVIGLVDVFVRVHRINGRWVFDCRRLVRWDAVAKQFVFEPLAKGKG